MMLNRPDTLHLLIYLMNFKSSHKYLSISTTITRSFIHDPKSHQFIEERQNKRPPALLLDEIHNSLASPSIAAQFSSAPSFLADVWTISYFLRTKICW